MCNRQTNFNSFLLTGGKGPPHWTCNFNSQMPTGGRWYPPHFTSSQSHVIGGGTLHLSPTKLNPPQQWNKTDFHCYMPAQLKLEPVYYFQVQQQIMRCTALLGYPSVQYTALHYWIMSFLEKCKLMVWDVLTMIKGCP